jgi:hypothetical protein
MRLHTLLGSTESKGAHNAVKWASKNFQLRNSFGSVLSLWKPLPCLIKYTVLARDPGKASIPAICATIAIKQIQMNNGHLLFTELQRGAVLAETCYRSVVHACRGDDSNANDDERAKHKRKQYNHQEVSKFALGLTLHYRGGGRGTSCHAIVNSSNAMHGIQIKPARLRGATNL